MKKNKRKTIGLFIIATFVCNSLLAHDVVSELEGMSKADAAILYVKLGFKHILPLGLDHILFVLSLFLLSPKLKPLLYQATAFTLAHSITLGLVMFNIISPSASLVEPIIAISIAYVAIENIVSPTLKKSRIGIVFLFGLIHGMGFANALSTMGLPQNAYLTSLLMFNIGVELAQITIILLAWFLIGKWFSNKTWYRNNFVKPISVLIAAVAIYWTIERIFFA
jgi:HupE / UreJ protein